MTIFRIAHFLEKFGHAVRFVIQNATHHSSGEAAAHTINKHFQEFRGSVSLLTRPLPILRGDALIATDRFTCFPARGMAGFRQKFYFVQDYETAFYPMGSEALLAESTYSMDLNCLCAGPWLHSLMKERYGLWSRAWPLAYDDYHYFTDPLVSRSSNRIAFYGRYVTPRRAVELGMMALSVLYERGLSFEVDFFGWPLGRLRVPYPYVDHGVLDAKRLADIYRKATVGLVFSATNYSLVNKEMMACGLPVVDLDVSSVRAVFPQGCIALAKPDPEGIADSIQHLLEKPEARETRRQEALKFITGLSWEKSARLVEEALRERICASSPDVEASRK